MEQTQTSEPRSGEGSRFLELGRELLDFRFRDHFDAFLIVFILVAIGVILHFLDNKLAFLNVFFLPVLVAGYFINARSAVLGGLLAVAWTTFFVVLDPSDFHQQMSRMQLYLHLVLWASFLVLSGALVGGLAEKLHARLGETSRSLEEVRSVKDALSETNRLLREQAAALEVTNARIAGALHTAMDPSIAKLALAGSPRVEKRNLSVLFADLAGFSAGAERRSPDSVFEDLARVYGDMEPVLERFRGHLDRYLGDGLMAEFGVPLAARNHALLASLAAVKMQERMAAGGFPWKMRIGVATGPSLVGIMGSARRKNFTAVGDAVELAARLEGLCPGGSVCVDEAAFKAAGRWFHARVLREGLADAQVRDLEARLELLAETIEHAPSAKLCMEAADICSELGDMQRALSFHKMALELDPSRRRPVERAVTAAILTSEERGFMTFKGQLKRVTAYQVTGLKDPLLDGGRLPAAVVESCRRLAAELRPAEDALLAIEALEGSLGHAPVVAALSASLAEALGLDDAQVRDAFLAGYYHDVGKRSVPEHLLSQDRRIYELPEVDQTMVRSHVAEAPRVLGELSVRASPGALAAIAQHHERFDGSGYPAGLRGAQIELLARVLQFADTYETLTAWRPYKDPWTPPAALSEMRRDVEQNRLDPEIGKVFWGMMGR